MNSKKIADNMLQQAFQVLKLSRAKYCGECNGTARQQTIDIGNGCPVERDCPVCQSDSLLSISQLL